MYGALKWLGPKISDRVSGWKHGAITKFSNSSSSSTRQVCHHHFDLVKEFDISRYLDILADKVASEGPPRNIAPVISITACERSR